MNHRLVGAEFGLPLAFIRPVSRFCFFQVPRILRIPRLINSSALRIGNPPHTQAPQLLRKLGSMQKFSGEN